MNGRRCRLAVVAACVAWAASPMAAVAAPLDDPAAALQPAGHPPERTRQLAEAVLVASGEDARLSALSETTAELWFAGLQRLLPNARPEWRPVMEAAIPIKGRT